ncbi:hypothetical protein Lal_00009150 [Lupinus albus]|nr:hypothetical protein Lal_00009150 [Lupinus albus]
MRLSLWIFLSWNRSEKWEERGEKAKTGGDIQRELAIIPATCLPSILKDTDMSLLNVPAGKELPEDIYVVIEIPANADPIKYEVDKESGALFVDRFMSTAMFYPCNYGYINHTLSLDGDPVDVLVPTPYPLQPGAVIRCRPVGVLKMTDESGEDAKLVAVPHTKLSKEYDHIKDVNDLPELLKAQITHFFEHYKDLEKGKWVKVDGWDNAEAAKAEIIASFERAAKKIHMSSINIDVARPTGIYFIIERLYSRDGFMPSIGEISPSLTQIKYITGSKVTTKDTDALVYTTDYIGSLAATTPLGNIEHENIPRFLTTESIHSLPQAVSYGRDPIPQVLLYGRKDIVFFMDNGGKGTPTAIAKYNRNTRDLAIIKDQLEAISLHHDIPACLVFVLLMDPLSKRLCDSAVFTVFPARHFKQYAVHKLLWPFTRLVFFMAYCAVHHAVRSSVFNPTPGYRRELKE